METDASAPKMLSTTSHCPHYRPYTLAWFEASSERLPCPPLYTSPCTSMAVAEEEEGSTVDCCCDVDLDELMPELALEAMDLEDHMQENGFGAIFNGINEANQWLVPGMELN